MGIWVWVKGRNYLGTTVRLSDNTGISCLISCETERPPSLIAVGVHGAWLVAIALATSRVVQGAVRVFVQRRPWDAATIRLMRERNAIADPIDG